MKEKSSKRLFGVPLTVHIYTLVSQSNHDAWLDIHTYLESYHSVGPLRRNNAVRKHWTTLDCHPHVPDRPAMPGLSLHR